MKTTIIFDEEIFPKEFVKSIEDSNIFDYSIIIHKYPNIVNYLSRFILGPVFNKKLFSISQSNIFVHTFSNKLVNMFVNNVADKNNVILCEDGMFPYYGLEYISYYNNRTTLMNSSIRERVKANLNKIKDTDFNVDLIRSIMLMNPKWLPRGVLGEYTVEQIKTNYEESIDAIKLLSKYYKIDATIPEDIDAVLFDPCYSEISGVPQDIEYNILYEIISELKNKKVFVKLRNNSVGGNKTRMLIFKKIESELGCNIYISNDTLSKMPWEIIYSKYYELFNSVVLVGNVSTATLSQIVFYGNTQPVIWINKIFKPYANIKVNDKQQSDYIKYSENIELFISGLSSRYYNSIFVPSSISEYRKVIHGIIN